MHACTRAACGTGVRRAIAPAPAAGRSHPGLPGSPCGRNWRACPTTRARGTCDEAGPGGEAKGACVNRQPGEHVHARAAPRATGPPAHNTQPGVPQPAGLDGLDVGQYQHVFELQRAQQTRAVAARPSRVWVSCVCIDCTPGRPRRHAHEGGLHTPPRRRLGTRAVLGWPSVPPAAAAPPPLPGPRQGPRVRSQPAARAGAPLPHRSPRGAPPAPTWPGQGAKRCCRYRLRVSQAQFLWAARSPSC